MKKAVVMLLLITSSCLIAGCNTVNGFGKDVEKVGEKMQDASRK